jgi:hypothetical protein
MRKMENGAIGTIEVCRAQREGFAAAHKPPEATLLAPAAAGSFVRALAAKQLWETGADGELGNKVEALTLLNLH